MALYELVARGADELVDDPAKRRPPNEFLSRSETLSRVSVLGDWHDLTGAQVLYESHLHDSERMVLAFLKSAAANGAVVGNYLSVTAFLHDGRRVDGARVTDEPAGEALEIRARVVVNAAGPWIPGLNATLPGARLHRQVTHFSRGSHIVTRAIESRYALALATTRPSDAVIDRGGRHVFVIPWRGRSLIGTSDAAFRANPDDVAPTLGDVTALLHDVNAALPSARLSAADVTYAYAGLYPLTADAVRPDVYQGTGHYQVVDHARQGGVDGLVSVLGAKYTTARHVAEMGADLVEDKLGRSRSRCQTATTPLVGGQVRNLADFSRRIREQHGSRLSPATLDYLVAGYGTEIEALMATAASEPEGLAAVAEGRETIGAQITYAIEHEQARRLEDVVFRRTGLGTLGSFGEEALVRCARHMGARLGWSAQELERQLAETSRRLIPPRPPGRVEL
jgi:glycerol-3-phosphate dehydrogenase